MIKREMRKMAPAVAVIVTAILAFTSCKKSYTCTCNIHTDADTTGNVVINANDTTVMYDFGKTSEQNAQNACAARKQSQMLTYLGSAKVNCDIN